MPRRAKSISFVAPPKPEPIPEPPKTVWIRMADGIDSSFENDKPQLTEMFSDIPAKVRTAPWTGEPSILCALHEVPNRVSDGEDFYIYHDNRWREAKISPPPKVVKISMRVEAYVTVDPDTKLEELKTRYRPSFYGMPNDRSLPKDTVSIEVTDYVPST